MIDWYEIFCKRSRRFYVVVFLLLMCSVGLGSFALYKYFDNSLALRESVLLYEAMKLENPNDVRENLQVIVARKCQPYAGIAAMYLAQLTEGDIADVKRRELYNFALSTVTSPYLKELSSLSLEIVDGEIGKHKTYVFTAQFLDALGRFMDGQDKDAEALLGNIDASVDANPYAKKLAANFLKALFYRTSAS